MYSFPLALWKAFQKDLEASDLRPNDVADACNVPYHVATRWFRLIAPDDELRPETPPPIHKFILAEKAMGQYRALQIACEELGGFFTLHPQVDLKDKLSLFKQVENLHRTTIKLSEAFLDAIADNEMTPEELDKIIQTATDNMAADEQMIECARKMLEKGEK